RGTKKSDAAPDQGMNVDLTESPKCKESPEQTQEFASRFSRYRPLLYSLARRLFGDKPGAENALENCWRRASRNAPEFEYEGAFRSWLARGVIGEAVGILRQNREPSCLCKCAY